MNPNQKSSVKTIVIVAIVLYVFALFLLVEYSAYAALYPHSEFSVVFSRMLSEMPENQFLLPAKPENIASFWLVMTAFFGLGLWWLIASEKANEHAAFGKEYGSAKFLSKIHQYSLKYADIESYYSEPGVKVPLSYRLSQLFKQFIGGKK